MTRAVDQQEARWSRMILLILAAGCADSRLPADPAHVLLVQNEGIEALRRDQLDAAESAFDSVIAMVPREGMGYGELGLVHLRRGNLAEAERRVRQGLEHNESDPELRLMLAAVLAARGDTVGARVPLEQNRAQHPDHIASLWALAELDRGALTQLGRDAAEPTGDAESAVGLARRASVLAELVERAPANAAARFEFARTLTAQGQADPAAAELEALRQQLPTLPGRVSEEFDSALTLLQGGDAASALPLLTRFEEHFAATSPYQEALSGMAGPQGQMVGVPTFSFSFEFSLAVMEQDAVLAQISFADGSRVSGLQEHSLTGAGAVLALADIDGDGDEDLIGARSSATGASVHRVDLGLFVDESGSSGLGSIRASRAVAPADYDNDGHLDLLFVGDAGVTLMHNRGDGTFEDVTGAAGIGVAASPSGAASGGPADLPPSGPSGSGALWADLDHDGDLDVLVYGAATRVLRNDGDGTFSDVTEGWGFDTSSVLVDVAFGDMDDDGDLDLVAATASGPALFTNDRGGSFRTVEVGLGGQGAARTVAVVDIDADGALDLVFGTTGGIHIWINTGLGEFTSSTRMAASADRVLSPIDFDNDGLWDLVAGGTTGLTLLRGDGTGALTDFSSRFPDTDAVESLAVGDYNEDGDLDLLLTSADGRFRLFRNDGASSAHYVQISLEGLAAGSSKNNRDGIGSRIEVSAGDLYQVHVVTDPTVHIGLGSMRKADVIRIEWTNGVSQDIYYPGTDQDLEDQILKGSCPMLFTWDGEGFDFQKDVMWKSALGMPTGIQGNQGARSYAPAAASREYVRIPGDRLIPRDGNYELRITEELWETIYMDEVKLLAVDHPTEQDIFVDERFVPPHLPVEFRPYVVSNQHAPVAAVDDRGRDVLGALLERDHVYASGLLRDRYQGTTEEHSITLDLGAEVASSSSVRLFLTGWVFPADASLNVAMAQADFRMMSPVLEVPDGAGGWSVAIPDVSFPSGKDKTIILDLSDRLRRDDPRVRIRTSMQIYWDWAFASIGDGSAIDDARALDRGRATNDDVDANSTQGLTVTTLTPSGASLAYRGFSHTFRKGGRNGPHWFDYDSVTAGSKWRDLTGSYTRYGDVQPLLTDADDMYVIMNGGDEVAMRFRADALPALPRGWTRDFVIYTVGWVKDGDLNTATGQTVGPLPFHGMAEYPYGPDERYPTDDTRQEFLRTYNTRIVDPNRSGPAELQGLRKLQSGAGSRRAAPAARPVRVP
jgi:tetratricopeptide (TPR) repeat protein